MIPAGPDGPKNNAASWVGCFCALPTFWATATPSCSSINPRLSFNVKRRNRGKQTAQSFRTRKYHGHHGCQPAADQAQHPDDDLHAGAGTVQRGGLDLCRRGMFGKKTILFIDEIHRFNKSQQDYLLPFVEDGTLILIGATTENPYFEVNGALLSRSVIFELKPLSKEDIEELIRRAVYDQRGMGAYQAQIEPDALEFLADIAGGDARAALNAVELGVMTTQRSEDGKIHLTLEVAQECIQKRAVKYDKTGDNHYDTISAFIKSMRGSDPDAAVYYLARMLYAGESVTFIARRMMICE